MRLVATRTATDPILANLNPPQQEAVRHTEGPALILAGAGSGKTRALTHRIAYLLQRGIKPWQILAVTFTNKAANEMKERIRRMLHIAEGEDPGEFSLNPGKLPVMGTFHSICARILRRDIEHLGLDRSFVIYDADDQERLMKEVLKDMKIDDAALKPKAALSYIGRFKAEAMGPSEAEVQATTERMHTIIQSYRSYNTALRKANALDFDDLILETVRLFHECPKVLERYGRTWRYLNVDEYQDTNHAQYLFISQLAGSHRNLCVIGDPDQSIYSFRGADIRNILEFEKEYPDAFQVKLEQNYRSTQLILTAADAVIDANPRRPQKKMWTERKEGPKVVVSEVEDERKEAAEAVESAVKLHREGTKLRDQVILYRTNAQSRLFEEACMKMGIPYRIVGGVKFYARREVKDVLAYLHVLLNPNDTVSLLRILNVPNRKIGQTTIGRLQAHGSAKSLTLWECLRDVEHVEDLNQPTKERITRFVTLIEMLRRRATEVVVSQLASELIVAIDLEKWLRDDTDEGEARWGNVQELLSVMHKYDQLVPTISLTSFLEEVALVSEVDALHQASTDALTLMTLHLCKGLEFESVTIAGCEEGIFPHSSSMYDREQLEEERRLMYVGMTRAKTNLHLLCARSRMLWGSVQSNPPSRFLDDLPDAVIERRSDDVLSAFAWASKRAEERLESGEVAVEPDQTEDLAIEFNQDVPFDADVNQEVPTLAKGQRIEHPTFGAGTVVSKRGDIVEVAFDSGERKHLALSIAPLKLI